MVDVAGRGHAVRMPTFMCIAYGDQDRLEHADEVAPLGVHGDDARVIERGAAIADMSCIEAPDGEEAARIMAETPTSGRHGVIEVWPLRSPASA